MERLSVDAVREILRNRIFEIENSLAMYQLYERAFPDKSGTSYFKTRYRTVLDGLRRRFGLPIALLAVTDQKYEAMRRIEFGTSDNEILANDDVARLTGFDAFFGPHDFREHIADGTCGYLLYVRSSDPTEKLKDPTTIVEQPLLSDAYARRVIKEHAITLNIDAPEMEFRRRINDTKEYLIPMRMAFPVLSREDVEGPAFLEYLRTRGMNPKGLAERTVRLRAKPLKGAHGGYGHVRGFATSEFFRRLRHEIHGRGAYVVQPEMQYHRVRGEAGLVYNIMDRVFFGSVDQTPFFLGGFRLMMPITSLEAKKGRNHGHADTIWAEIVTREPFA